LEAVQAPPAGDVSAVVDPTVLLSAYSPVCRRCGPQRSLHSHEGPDDPRIPLRSLDGLFWFMRDLGYSAAQGSQARPARGPEPIAELADRELAHNESHPHIRQAAGAATAVRARAGKPIDGLSRSCLSPRSEAALLSISLAPLPMSVYPRDRDSRHPDILFRHPLPSCREAASLWRARPQPREGS